MVNEFFGEDTIYERRPLLGVQGATDLQEWQDRITSASFVAYRWIKVRLDPLETVGEVKRRLQLKVIKGGTPSPTPSISMSRRGELVVVVERRRRTTKPNPGWEGSFSC